MKFSTLKNSFFFLSLLICSTQTTDLPIKIEQIGNNAQTAIQAAADAGKNAARALFPERTLADKIKDGITQGADFLRTQVDNLSSLLTKNTSDSVKAQFNDGISWINKNPEKTAAIGCAAVATYFLAKWLFKPTQRTAQFTNPETAKSTEPVIVPANIQEEIVAEVFATAESPLERATAALEQLSPENFDGSKAIELATILRSFQVSPNNNALNVAINKLCATIKSQQVSYKTQLSENYKNCWARVNTLLSQVK